MINKIDFNSKNLTSNAGLFLLLENAKDYALWHFTGIDKIERLKFLKNDPLVHEFDISVKEPETVSRFLGKFNFKTT